MALVPNQRNITINKEKCDSHNLYTMNNLKALDKAALDLQSKGGFKLYMYLAKNQDKYNFNLSSSDFCIWSGLGITAYRTAFNELVDNGYLVKKEDSETIYKFYDLSKKENIDSIDNITVENQEETVKEIQDIKKSLESKFIF